MTESDFNTEVRTLFAEDARAFLARMESASALLNDAQALAPKSFSGLKAARPFDAIEDAAQSIRGSASSVDAEFLAESAAFVEELARRGANALDLVAAHAARAHAMAAYCNDAMREMTAMLSLYVEEAPEEASWLAMVLRERGAETKKADDDELERLAEAAGGAAAIATHAAMTNRPPVPDGKHIAGGSVLPPDSEDTTFMPVEEFAFDEIAQPPPLKRIFQDEARELMLALKGHVETFLRTRTASGLESIEPLLHTLKGSAASVELPYLSAQAAEAMAIVGRLRRSQMGDGLGELVVAINRLLATVAIPTIDAALAGPAGGAPHVEVPEVFASEVQRVLEGAGSIASEMSSAAVTKESATRLASDAAKLFHRLKGTSLVVGAKMIADEADAVMVACKNLGDRAMLAVAIAEGCERIKALLPQTASAFAFDEPVLPVARARRTSVRPSEPPNFISDGLLAIFREEVIGLLGPLSEALARLDTSPRDSAALEAAQRVFHTLKGTAAAVGQLAMSADAAAIEQTLDDAIEDPRRVAPGFVEKLRRDARTVLEPLGLAGSLLGAAEELSDEDLVEISADDLEDVEEVVELEGGASIPIPARVSSPPALPSAASAAPSAAAAASASATSEHAEPSEPPPSAVSAIAPEQWDDFVSSCSDAIASALEQTPDADAPVDELAAIFNEEVEQLAPSIFESFDKLIANPRDLSATRTLERYFHTLKGSAATVDRQDLSAPAEALRSALEAVGGGVELTPARVLALKGATEQLLAVATRPAPLHSSASPAARVEGAPAFSFDDAGQDGDARANDELLKIFQQEAREALIALQGHVETLMTTPTSIYAAEYIQRLFHTLKGAAATVGLAEISTQAAGLQTSMEEVLGNKRTPDALFIEDLVARTNDLLRTIGVAPLVFRQNSESAGLSSAPSLDDSADDIERRIFTGEVKGICRQASAKVRELLDATDPEVSVKLRTAIADLFHRLKGTAATVGAHVIAEEAGRATDVARGKAAPREIADVVRAAIVRIADLAGFERVQARRERDKAGLTRELVQVPEEAELWESFEQECAEILDALEKAVLSLEEVAQPKVVVDEIFRHVHTLKGAVNTVGLSPTGKVLHTIEDFLEALTKAAIMPPMRTVAGILIDVCKEVRQNLRSARTGWVETSLDAIAARTEAAMHPGSRTGTDLVDRSSGPATGNLKSLFDSAALFGTAAFHNASDSASANGSRQSGKSENGSANDSNSSDERAYIRVATTRLDALMNLAGELVVSRSRMASRVGTLRFLYRELGRSRVRLTNTVETFRDQYEFANIGGKASRQSTRMTRTVEVTEVVSSTGELARTGSGGAGGRGGGSEVFGELELDEYGDIHVLSRSLAEIGNDFEEAFRTLSSELSSFAEDADSLGGIISGIQGEVTRARMVPLDAVFTRLRFPVRDAATRDSKDVHVITEGGDVNIDKTIADAILQPMLHLVRNAVAHGIESPARRAALGKDRVGTVKLVARQQSGQIVIEVNDDGAGLDLAALRARGIAQGLITTDVTIDDPRVKELVFASGLSTRELANDVAGRGVGGEVVKRTIERLNGAIRIETTRGKGTSFVIALPLTLAITRALLVSEGHATYAVPLYFAERIIDAESLNIVETGDERRVLLDGQFTRVRRLDEYFGGAGTGVKRGGPALVLRVGDERMVLQLDAVLGQEEIVVKRAGELLEGHPLFAGVTLRGTGDLVLIVDIPGLLAEFAKAHRPTDDVAGPTHPMPIEVLVEARPTPEPKKRADRSLPKPKAAPALLAPPQKRGADAAGAKAKGKAEGAAEPVAAPPRAVVAPPQALAGVRALVVDDSLSVRKVAEAHLRGLGVEVVVAVDGVDGLAKLREGTFDVIFTDLEMPRMHGYDFIRQLRLLAVYQDLPVVVVSSRSGQKHQDHARSVGATDYITKPFSAQSLEATIRKWLRG